MMKTPCAMKSCLIAMLLMGAAVNVARATVTAIDDVLPADNIATPGVEGIPEDGNTYNISDPANAQTRWEKNEDIIVGQKLSMGGRLEIDGLSQLRYQNLIIGDQGTVNGQMRKGKGVVLITGLGALYSNDPNSLPPWLPPNFAVAPSVARPIDAGFDLLVGNWGQGRLEIRGGGRAEIQDAVIVGNNPGSTGEIIVDGFGSMLASGGFDGGAVLGEIHQFIVGRRSVGIMQITNGGLVVSEAPQSIGEDIIGAVIGSDPYDNQEPEPGGIGTVTVNGTSSKWIIGGSLQIGGFHDSLQGAQQDVSGTNVEYNSEAGRGTLYVQDGALVSVVPAIGADEQQDDLLLVIGRFGRLDLSGGTVTIGNPGELEDNTQLLNDGVITGTGRINTGVFINRYVGEVRIKAGDSLIIDAAAEFISPAEDSAPMLNYGVVRLLGTVEQRATLEFERAPDAPTDPIQPFRNVRVERPAGAPVADFYGGLISGQHSTLIFRSGLDNSGMVAFTEGMNYVVGNVFNLAAPVGFPNDFGIIRVWGAGTRAVFENDLINGGQLSVLGGASIDVLQRHSFVTAGELIVDVDPTKPSPINTAGDVGIAGKLVVNIKNVTPGTLVVGQTFDVITFGGQIGGVDLTDPLRPAVDLDTAPLFTSLVVTPSLATLGLAPGLVLIPEFTINSVVIAVRSTIGHVGPDFNGDGVIDGLDLAIWKAHKGITSGASVLQGDANGDGAVDGADYLIWLQQWTMGPGAGAGGGSVPEPTALALVAIGGLMALATRRRR